MTKFYHDLFFLKNNTSSRNVVYFKQFQHKRQRNQTKE